MFPLGSVLLPGMVMPLHIFEERFRVLVRDCLAGNREFGVVMIERGSEVGGGDIRAMAGTMAEIVQAEELDDGRWALLAVGSRRFRVEGWRPDDRYPVADVEEWPDVVPYDHDDATVAYADRVAQLRRVLTLAVRLGAEVSPDVELSDDLVEGSYQIATLAPFGALDRQRLLVAPSVDARFALLEELLDDQELMITARLEDL